MTGNDRERQEKETWLSWGWEVDTLRDRFIILVSNLALYQPGLFTFLPYPLLHSRMDRGPNTQEKDEEIPTP